MRMVNSLRKSVYKYWWVSLLLLAVLVIASLGVKMVASYNPAPAKTLLLTNGAE